MDNIVVRVTEVPDEIAVSIIGNSDLAYTPEDVANKVTTFQSVPDDTHYASEKLVKDNLDLKQNSLGFTAENTSYKVTAFQGTPDDVHYASEKLIKDSLDGKQATIGYTTENSANKVDTFQVTPDNTHYPSEKLTKDSLDGKSDTSHTHSSFPSPITVDAIDFDTATTATAQAGRLMWDEDSGTLQVGMVGGTVNLQIGQEILVRAENTTGVEIVNGSVVYISGAHGNRPTIALADADTIVTSSTILGLTTESIADNTQGFVCTFGLVREVDTSAYTEGATLYLSQTAGEFIDTAPVKPAVAIPIGTILYQHPTNGIILVSVKCDRQIFDGGMYVGDVSRFGTETSYSDFEADGTLHFTGDATVFDDISLSGLSLTPGGSSAPDLISFVNSNLQTYGFDGGGTMEKLYITSEMKHDYKEGSDIEFHVHWTPTDAGTGNVKWQLYYSWQAMDGTFSTPTLLSIVSPARGTTWQNTYASFGTVSGTGKTIHSQLVLQLFRDPGDADDTYTSDAALVALGIHYEKDTVGSRSRTTK